MYILLEIQTTNGQTTLLPPLTYTDRLEADSAFHTKMASAAISSVNVHTVVLINEYGNFVRPPEYYEHVFEPQSQS